MQEGDVKTKAGAAGGGVSAEPRGALLRRSFREGDCPLPRPRGPCGGFGKDLRSAGLPEHPAGSQRGVLGPGHLRTAGTVLMLAGSLDRMARSHVRRLLCPHSAGDWGREPSRAVTGHCAQRPALRSPSPECGDPQGDPERVLLPRLPHTDAFLGFLLKSEPRGITPLRFGPACPGFGGTGLPTAKPRSKTPVLQPGQTHRPLI